jgi:acyl carrier protein
MQTSTASSPVAASSREPKLQNLPAAVRAAFEKFRAGGDPEALDPVVLAILADYSPRRPGNALADLPGNTRLIADLGFDSLAITEVVFAAEDLFRINITNDEIVQVHTLDDLRGFIRAKVNGRTAG